MIMAS